MQADFTTVLGAVNWFPSAPLVSSPSVGYKARTMASQPTAVFIAHRSEFGEHYGISPNYIEDAAVFSTKAAALAHLKRITADFDVEDDDVVVVVALEDDALLVVVELGADEDDDDEAKNEAVDDRTEDDEATDELAEESLDVLEAELDGTLAVVLGVVVVGTLELLVLGLGELAVLIPVSDDGAEVLLEELIIVELEITAVLEEVVLDD